MINNSFKVFSTYSRETIRLSVRKVIYIKVDLALCSNVVIKYQNALKMALKEGNRWYFIGLDK